MSWVATAVSVVATIASAAVSVSAQQQAASTTRKVAEFKAKTAENEALRVDMETREQMRRTREENKKLLARQRAKYAASGVTTEGTPLEVMGETAGILELGLLDQARASRNEQQRLITQAGVNRFEGRQAQIAANYQTGGTLLSTTASVAGQIGTASRYGGGG